ncbi:cytochrome P450 [Neolewinella aurantiaca]|uniref:Cytochrome P450 n=1 Tax=Neolewinella aurantiaca TaxID=2602767 RepID=A0A5C7FTU5_9BACT|nr:cytochrome P450 [Neolewinella aurantiaca]TXF89690.1 cytochrome P450 [Neolewinella aurantiaca]
MTSPPQVPLRRVLPNIPFVARNPIKYFSRYVKDYGADFLLAIGGSRLTHFTVNADVIQHVLQRNHKNYHKSVIQTRDLARYLGHGLLTNNGEPWLTQRRLIQPGFHRKRLASLVTEMQAVINRCCTGLDQVATSGEATSLHGLTTDLVFRVIARAIFTDGFNDEETKELNEAIDAVQGYVIYPVRMPFLRGPLRWIGQERKHLQITTEVRARIQLRIEDRRAGEPKDDLLQMLLDSRYEDSGEPMEDQQLVDEIMILFAAGHETSANALAWTLWLLDQHPEVREKIRAEIAVVETEGPVGFKSARKLTYLTQVIEESMRMYPPAWITDRVALTDDQAGGYNISSGTSIAVFIHGLHHNPEYWDSPESFRPERMSAAAKKTRHPMCYLPFGAGPRLCIGNHFAMLEMQLILVRLLRDYDFVFPEDAGTVGKKALITLQMDREVKVNLRKR